MGKPQTLGEITKKIYGNDYARNEIVVYKSIENLVQSGFLRIVCNGGICYQVNVERVISCLVDGNLVTQISKDKFIIN
jgi:hypothetical protein